jgi:hypothetical protein
MPEKANVFTRVMAGMETRAFIILPPHYDAACVAAEGEQKRNRLPALPNSLVTPLQDVLLSGRHEIRASAPNAKSHRLRRNARRLPRWLACLRP